MLIENKDKLVPFKINGQITCIGGNLHIGDEAKRKLPFAVWESLRSKDEKFVIRDFVLYMRVRPYRFGDLKRTISDIWGRRMSLFS